LRAFVCSFGRRFSSASARRRGRSDADPRRSIVSAAGAASVVRVDFAVMSPAGASLVGAAATGAAALARRREVAADGFFERGAAFGDRDAGIFC